MSRTLLALAASAAALTLLAGCASRTDDTPATAPALETTPTALAETTPARPSATPDRGALAAQAAFDGADCFAARVSNCLGVNPAVDALATDPERCLQAERRVCLVPVGKVRLDLVQDIIVFHKRTKDIDVLVLPSIPLDPSAIDTKTSQLTQRTVWDLVKSTYGATGDTTNSSFIAITPFDMRPADGQYAWWFGARIGISPLGYNHGVFSYFRMANVPPYDGRRVTDKLVQERTTKYFARYVALLYLDYPMADAPRYLNYNQMGGFSALDTMHANWPPYPPACMSGKPTICIVPDREYVDEAFEEDLLQAADELRAETGLPIEVRLSPYGFQPSLPDWGDEYAHDLFTWRGFPGEQLNVPNVTIVGITDDALANNPGIAPKLDHAVVEERLVVTSGYGAGKPGTASHRAHLKLALLRAVALARGVPLNDDPTSLMYRNVTTSAELEGKTPVRLP